jgi:peptidoglycan/xylan/chitin deacetylase (PgdA/CDA1 family)
MIHRRTLGINAAAVMTATAIVTLFVLTMAVEQILPSIGEERALVPVTVPPPTCQKGRVALTFDGGPDPAVTAPLLALLRQRHVAATFFVDADRAAEHGDLLHQLADAGHLVALSAPRPAPGDRTGATSRVVMQRGRALFAAFGLAPPTLVRPASGHVDHGFQQAVADERLTMVTWTGDLDTGDRDLVAPATIRRRILDNLRPRGVILAHDTALAGENTVAALGSTIDEAFARGYCFDRLDVPQNWDVFDPTTHEGGP